MKETFYFSHDYNARNDEKIKRMMRSHWMLWYGVYWAIIEDLYQNENEMIFDCEWIAFDMRVDQEVIRSILMDFGLFETNISYFSSKSVWERLAKRLEKSAKARESAEKRWWKKNANAKQTQSDWNAIKESKGKESKVKENKTEQSSQDDDRESLYNNKIIKLEEWFEKFWNLYPKKVDKKKANQRFMNLNLNQLENLFVWLDLYNKKWKSEKTGKQFIPSPSVWLNGEKWCDEIIIEPIPNERSDEQIQELKKKKAQEDEEKIKKSEKINAEKKKISDFWNSLLEKEKDNMRSQAKINAMKRYNKTREFIDWTFWKSLIQAELWILIKEKIS